MQVIIEEKRLTALENRISEILSKLTGPATRIEKTEKDFYTIAQVADILDWSAPKVFKEMKAGNIRSHKVNGRTLIIREELIEDVKKFPA